MTAWLRKLKRRFQRRNYESELGEEFAFHLEMRERRFMEQGMAPEEARQAARKHFGNLMTAKEDSRATRGFVWLEALWRDVRYGARSLGRAKGFTAVAVLSLALGIGANTAIFSVVNAVLLGVLPYKEPGRLVAIFITPPGQPGRTEFIPIPLYVSLRDNSRMFESVGGVGNGGWPVNLGSSADGFAAERLQGSRFSAAMYEVLGVEPEIGRFYTSGEDAYGAAPVVVLSHSLWQRRFGGDRNILGQTIDMDGVPTTVLGVMPLGFDFFPESADFWRTLPFAPHQLQSHLSNWIRVAARLKPGVSIEQAQAEAESIAAEFTRIYPATHQGWTIELRLLDEAMLGSMHEPFLLMQGAVGFVLLIACANLAGLLLARGSSRQHEIAIRSALGAGRFAVIRRLLVESVLLAFGGGFLGVLLAWLAIRPLTAMTPEWFLRHADISLDARVLGFTAAVSILTGLLFGSFPAFNSSKPDLAGSLKDSARGSSAGMQRQRLRGVLVALEVAMAVVLLVGAGLMINSFIRVQNNDLGSDPRGLLTFQVALPIDQHAKLVGSEGTTMREFGPAAPIFFDRVFDRLRNLPGVQSVAGADSPPLTGAQTFGFSIEGRQPPASAREANNAAGHWITPNYFSTMRIRLLRGRDIGESDTAASDWVVVINQEMARRFWPNEDPIGKRITFTVLPEERPRQIVGVVADAKLFQRQVEPLATMYMPHSQQLLLHQGRFAGTRLQMTFIIRTRDANPLGMVGAARNAVAEIDPNQPLSNPRTAESYLDRQALEPRYYTLLLSIFGMVAIVLAAIGIYGVIAYSVAQRTHEIGVRRALGASTWSVLRMIVSQGLLLVSAGVIVGLAAAAGLTRFLTSYLWGVEPTDPPTFAAITVLLMLVGLLACLVPSLRATKIDPLTSLRHE